MMENFQKDLDEVLEFLDLRKSEFLDIINKHRNEEIWYKNNKKDGNCMMQFIFD